MNDQSRAEIRPVKERVEDELISRPGVVGVDIGEKVPVLLLDLPS